MAIALLLASAVLAGCSSSSGRATGSGASGPSGRAPTAQTPGPTTTAGTVTGVGTLSLPYVDRSRPTVSHGRQVAPVRALTTEVWYPKGLAGPRPLLVFAAGFQVGLGPYRRACTAWAERGFVVAAPMFPLTDQAVAGPNLDEADIANQPADVSFVITQLLATAGSSGTPLTGMIDPTKIAVAGHSDGAETALLVGYSPDHRDPRVKAVVSDAANPLDLQPPSAQIQSSVPLLVVLGDADRTVAFQQGLRVTTQVLTPGWLLVLHGADHLPPISGPSPWTPVFDRVTGDFLVDVLAGDPDTGAALQADASGTPSSLTPLSGR